MAYLVTGATGNIGGRVVDLLLGLGERPRVLARDPARARARFGERVDAVAGDLSDPRTLAPALAGVEAVFLVNVGPELARRDEIAARAAGAADVKRLVKLSSLDVASNAAGEEDASRTGTWHARGEAAVRSSGVPWVFVRPTGFMSNALAWAGSIRASGVVRASTGGGRVAMVHPDDVAAVAVCALTSPRLVGRALPVTGPEALTYRDMADRISVAIDKPVGFQCITDEEARAALVARGMTAEADALVALWRSIREGPAPVVTDTVERVLGRRPFDFQQWARENAAAFR